MSDNISILQLIDALNAGGSERVVVNLANELAYRGYKVTLCTSRRGGPLQAIISPRVSYFCLNRLLRFDLLAIFRLVRFTSRNKIHIIHAHSSSLFLAILVKLFLPKVKIIWHTHFGAIIYQTHSRSLYCFFVRFVDGIIAVNRLLADWAINTLHVTPKKVWFLPNFIQQMPVQPEVNLPGEPGFRLICVAHLRKQKDHITLIRAMNLVVQKEPRAHLLLVGKDYFPDEAKKIWSEISRLNLVKHITWLGERENVQDILASSDIGVLSSSSEGLPLALLDYGLASLPVVATDVGECAQVLDHGKAGVLVPPRSPQDLANGILFYLNNPAIGVETGLHFKNRVKNIYSAEPVLRQLEKIYHHVLGLNEE